MSGRQGFNDNDKQNRLMLSLDGQETNTIAQNVPIVNGFGEDIPPSEFAALSQTSTQFQEQTQEFYYQHQWQAQQQVNYEEYLRQCNPAAMLQLIPLQVPISIQNGQMFYSIIYVPLWSLTGQMPGLFMPSIGPLQPMAPQVTNIYFNGQNQQFYSPLQQNDVRYQNISEIQEIETFRQVQEQPVNLVVERKPDSHPINSQVMFTASEVQQIRSRTVDINIMPGLGNGVIN